MTNTADTNSNCPTNGAGSFDMTWDKATTPLEAIERALYRLADRVTGAVVDAGDRWTLTAYPSERAQEQSLTHRVRQEVNDQTLRLRIAERTDPIRNLVFALAFSRAGLPSGAPTDAERLDQ